MTLRSSVIRLAHSHPDLRSHLLPLLKKGSPTLSRVQEVWFKSILEEGKEKRPIPKATFEALRKKGLVKGGQEVSMLDTGQYGLVMAEYTPEGRDFAVSLFRAEHEERLRKGEKSERIPKLLRSRGIEI